MTKFFAARFFQILLLSILTAQAVHAQAVLNLTIISPADDERLDPTRIERNYLGHPGGPAIDGVKAALDESAFEIDAAKLKVKLNVQTASDAKAAAQIAATAEKQGAAAIITDAPADWIVAIATATKLAVFNTSASSDALRQQQCRANLFHTYPSERMLADANAQWLTARRWSRVLLLHGTSAEDTQRLAVVEASMKRYGLKTVAKKAFKLSADPRERDLANTTLLTGGADYDVVWVVDADGEFARTLPYRTQLARPVIGNAGLVAEVWSAQFERFGAPQLIRRFAKQAGNETRRPMRGQDWASYMAAKTLLQMALSQPKDNAATWTKSLSASDTNFDGFKGVRLSYRAWDRQLRQPILLTDGQGVIGTAPIEGIMHPSNALDTLGADAPEKLCKAP
jgi:ABC transporter substrate binding protein (PQQ-dependent alcohol dehydrogenase system)